MQEVLFLWVNYDNLVFLWPATAKTQRINVDYLNNKNASLIIFGSQFKMAAWGQ